MLPVLLSSFRAKADTSPGEHIVFDKKTCIDRGKTNLQRFCCGSLINSSISQKEFRPLFARSHCEL
jgi:hypothetical protein